MRIPRSAFPTEKEVPESIPSISRTVDTIAARYYLDHYKFVPGDTSLEGKVIMFPKPIRCRERDIPVWTEGGIATERSILYRGKIH